MNLAGLCTYFQVSDWEEAESLLEDELFAIKQHFITKPWINATAKSRLKKATELGAFFTPEEFVYDLPKPVETNEVLIWWTNYQQLLVWGKQQLMQADNPLKLVALLDVLFQAVHERYAQVPVLSYTNSEPVFGSEPDPMLVQKEIIAVHSRGISTFAEIFEQRETISEVLLLVCKRWSLLVNYV